MRLLNCQPSKKGLAALATFLLLCHILGVFNLRSLVEIATGTGSLQRAAPSPTETWSAYTVRKGTSSSRQPAADGDAEEQVVESDDGEAAAAEPLLPSPATLAPSEASPSSAPAAATAAAAAPSGSALPKKVEPSASPAPQPVLAAGSLELSSHFPRFLAGCDHEGCTGERKVISMALYGDSTRYTVGAVRNSEIVQGLFPDWQLWIYMPEAWSVPVPADVQEAVKARGGVIVTVRKATSDAVGFGMNQRFLAAADETVDKYAVRDCDCRLLLRDRWAMDEWEESGLPFHVLRDHPSHSSWSISGGLWGGRKGAVPNLRALLDGSTTAKQNNYLADMNFLANDVWPLMQQKGARQHDAFSCNKWGAGGTAFPYPRAGGEHVGGVYGLTDNINEGHVGMLIGAYIPPECFRPEYKVEERVQMSPEHLIHCSMQEGAQEPVVTASAVSNMTGPAAAAFVAATQLTAGVQQQGKKCSTIDNVKAGRGANLVGGVAAKEEGQSTATAAGMLLELKMVFLDEVQEHCTSMPASAASQQLQAALQSGSSSFLYRSLPAIFDYRRVVKYNGHPEEQCGSQYLSAAQLHSRVGNSHTYYTAFPAKMRYLHNGLFTEASYGSSSHFITAFSLPYTLWFLNRGPSNGLQVLPDNTETLAAYEAAAAVGIFQRAAEGRSADIPAATLPPRTGSVRRLLREGQVGQGQEKPVPDLVQALPKLFSHTGPLDSKWQLLGGNDSSLVVELSEEEQGGASLSSPQRAAPLSLSARRLESRSNSPLFELPWFQEHVTGKGMYHAFRLLFAALPEQGPKLMDSASMWKCSLLRCTASEGETGAAASTTCPAAAAAATLDILSELPPTVFPTVPSGSCGVSVLVGDSESDKSFAEAVADIMAEAGLPAPTVLHACSVSPKAQAEALSKSRLLLLPADAYTPYLMYLPRGAKLVGAKGVGSATADAALDGSATAAGAALQAAAKRLKLGYSEIGGPSQLLQAVKNSLPSSC